MPRKPRPGDVLTLTIDRLGHGGLGVGTLETRIGPQAAPRTYSVEVRHALPAEVVRARIEGIHRRLITARAEDVTNPHPARQTPRCAHAGPIDGAMRGCGGCSLQGLGYAAQLDEKRAIVQTALEAYGQHAGERVEVPAVLGMPSPWFYRNKMEFSFADDRDRTLDVGLHPPGYKYEVIGLTECVLLAPDAGEWLRRVRVWAGALGVQPFRARKGTGFLRTLTVREGKRTGDRVAILTTTGDELTETVDGERPARWVVERFAEMVRSITQADGSAAFTSVVWGRHRAQRGTRTSFETEAIWGPVSLRETLHIPDGPTLTFEIHPLAFFQPNTLQAEVMYGQVLDMARPERSTRVLDLYCGTGTIGLAIASRVAQVTGIELVADAVDNARANAVRNEVDNVHYEVGDVGKVLPEVLDAGAYGVVIVDPPRAGLMAQAMEHIKAVAAPTLVYVSCNPTALGRDLVALHESGYRVAAIQPVDMFPHTGHVETVVRLVLGSAPHT